MVSGTTISGNSISDSLGSAVDASGGPVTISGSTFTGNMAYSGFGTLSLNSPMATLTTCVISGNASGMGGSIVNNGTLTVSDSTVSGNTSGGTGTAAGIVNSGTLTLSTSTVSGNSGFAGGIWNSATLTVSNSTVSGNSSAIQGVQTAGGIVDIAQNGNAAVQLLNATVANNTVNGNNRSSSQLLATSAGTSTSQATIELHNTLIAGDGSKPNLFADTGGSFVSDGHNLSSDDGGGYLTGPGDLVNTNPLLSPLQDNGGPTQTMALLPGSPAIDAGDNTKEVYNFSDPTGSFPCTGMIQAKNGKLYGATGFGGANSSGEIYNVTTAGVHTSLHDFNNTTDASCGGFGFPTVSLLQVTDGSFYGINYAGGLGCGSIYKLTSANVFSAFLLPVNNQDGCSLDSTLIQNTNGLVYGTALAGGAPLANGTFFSVSTGDAPFVNLEPTQRTGFVGASVGMFGQGFSGSSAVKFGGVAATKVTLSGTSYLSAVVPAGAHTGSVTVTTGATTLTSPQTFKVKPKITSFSPPSGATGTPVTINGSGLTQATAVKFGTVKATTFTVVSDSEVTADVPSGLAAGAVPISITTPGGAANSPTKFTVN